MIFGKPFSSDGNIDHAVGWCNGMHGLLGGDLVGLATGQGFHAVGGNPQFDGWPKWTSTTHQQVYVDWLKRAVDGGLRLMVVHAVNNKVLCGLVGPAGGRSCNDMEAVDRQIAGVKALEAYIDSISGGPGQGWYRIAYTGAQARQIASSPTPKLAVVIGIEVDELFDCGINSPVTCDEAHVKSELQRYYAMGVRHLFPIHVFNNKFGGAAIYNNDFNTGNKIVTGNWLATRDCSGEGYGFNFGTSLFGSLLAFGLTGSTPPDYPAAAECNAQGLTPLGEGLVRKMMSRKMIIDVDHLSALAADRALQLAESQQFPVVAGHTGLTGISIGEKNSEGQKTDAQIQRIAALGGLIAPILHQGKTSEVAAYSGAPVVPNDCDESSHSWAQAYMYVKERVNGGAVALGTDFNGLAGLPAPRFGSEACHGNSGQAGTQDPATKVQYPFQADDGTWMYVSQIGGDADHPPRTVDYNTDGLAHMGLLPDMIQDLKRSGMSAADLDPLYRSAEAYIAMWERIDAKNVYPPSSSMAIAPAANSKGWNNADVTVTLNATENPDGFGVNLNYSSTGATTLAAANTAVVPVTVGVSNEGTSTFAFRAFDNAGNGEATKSGVVKLDKTAPTLSCASPDAAWHATDVSLACTGSDATSLLADATNDAAFSLTTNVPAGTETNNASTGSRTVADNADNSATVGPYSGIKVDKKASAITITTPTSTTYTVNESVLSNYGCADGGSGVATCAGPVASGAAIATGSAGNLAFTVNSTDAVANASSLNVPYKVTYKICPMFDQTKSNKAGSTIPVRLQICDVNSNNLSNAAVLVNALQVVRVSSAASTQVEDAGNANPDSNFRFAGDSYLFNLATTGLTTGTFELRFNVTGDPITHAVVFQVR